MTAIDIGPGATDRAATETFGYTEVDLNNPANDNGKVTSAELWFNTNAAGVKFGTFSRNVALFTPRDYETIGNVTSGAKQTFTGLDISVNANDLAGIYWSSGTIEATTSGGTGIYYKAGDQFGAGEQTYTAATNYTLSIYGSGETIGWPNISKVNGIAAASISKMDGIAVANITKINGVAV